jgi:hypothetical protein
VSLAGTSELCPPRRGDDSPAPAPARIGAYGEEYSRKDKGKELAVAAGKHTKVHNKSTAAAILESAALDSSWFAGNSLLDTAISSGQLSTAATK